MTDVAMWLMWSRPATLRVKKLRPPKLAGLALLASVTVCWLLPAVLAGASTITYVQGNYATPQTPQTSVGVTFTTAQAAGDLNVVAVGWNDSTATVGTVTDKSGNTYTRAVGPTVQSGLASQSIYYAKNIVAAAAGANIVTITFSSAAVAPDIRILEYKGADPNNPVDVTAAGSGSSATSSSASVTTTNATDLLFGANLVQTTTTGAGSSFTKRILTSPDGDIAEDRMVTATGSYTATAAVSPANSWIMQMVAFRTPVSGGTTAPPTVSNVSPNGGSTAGGTAVTITGANFASGATVTFGGAAVTKVVVVSSTTITATTPAGSAGTAIVTVTLSGQSGSLPSGFTYVVIPTVTSVSPNSGPPSGGTAVSIAGTNFASGATVMFGSTAATNVVVVNSTSITAATPAGSTGAVTVTITVNGQSGNLTNGFTYVATPTVTSVSPNSGSTAGGTAVTITGTNFASGATVTFGGTAATKVVVVNSTTITAATPAGSAGAATVTVTVSAHSGSLTGGFTYAVVPKVTSVSPNSGSTAGGTAVTITGTNFASGATVTFGSTAASNVVVMNTTTITATTPATSAGAVTVTITINGQSGSLASGFTYIGIPTVTGVSPNTGSTSGGTAVTITGTNFATGATMTFGGTAATKVTVVNSTTITATTPAGSGGSVTVTVTVSGQSGSLTAGFTYAVVPTVSSVSPNSGSTAGGATVTISGSNFASGATVTFGGIAATNVVVVSSTSITATTPAGSAGSVIVTVAVAGQSGSLASGFTYMGIPTVTGVAPNTGSTSGGTAVTITGSNFASGATVAFGGTAATKVVVVSATQITATTPAGTAGAVTVTVTNTGALSGSFANAFTYAAVTTITYVQSADSDPQAPQTSMAVTFASAQAAGDLNVVVVGWNDSSATVSTVTDKSGNTYTRAVGPTVQSGLASQSIYYARNIVAAAAGANSVTITFSTAAAYPDIRILEYKGADPNNPVDVTAASSGNSATSSSGAVTTTNATDLLFGANLVQTTTTGSGTGFTKRLVSSPDGDIAEDEMVTTTGSYSATAAVSPSNSWIMQLVAFRTASANPTPPTVSNVSPNGGSTVGGTAVTITGTNFASGATVTFGGTAATNVVVMNATTITATTPPGSAGAATVAVTNPGSLSGVLTGGFNYLLIPTVTSVSPNSGSTAGATAVTITGTNFALGATVTFGGTAATNVVVMNATTITATTPPGSAGAAPVAVTNPGSLSGGLTGGFTYLLIPTVTSVSPNSGSTTGTAVTITGTNFASGATVTFGGTAATNVVVMNATTITATTPPGSAGAVTVTVSNPGAQSGSLANAFTYLTPATITYVQSNAATPQTSQASVSVTFTAAQAAGDLNVVVVGWNDSTATVSTVTDTSGNIYTLAVGPTVLSGVASQSIYYSPNMVAAAPGGNSVTVAFSTAATNPDIRILEYSGTDPNNPVDVIAASNGMSATASSGSVATTNATDLLFGANIGQTLTTGPGNGFTQRLLTSNGDIAEDEMMTAVGTYSASAPLSSSGSWIMQMVAFRTPSVGIPSPTVTGISPGSGSTAGGTTVMVTGTNFASGAIVTFGANVAANIVVVSSTTITAVTPTGSAGPAMVTITNPGAQSGSLANGFTYGVATTGTTINYVQGISATPQSSQTSVSVTFTAAQAAGDLNVVVVGWSDSIATVSSVTDASGNVYTLAVGPTIISGVSSQSIYYAKNIIAAAPGGNSVTVAFSSAATNPDLRILEYSGADLNNPVDVTAASTGMSANSSSGVTITTNAIDLLLGADLGQTITTGPGNGFTQRLLTSNSDIAEDEMLTMIGSYGATAPLGAPGQWIMQMVAFRTPSTPPTAPGNLMATTASTSQINLSWTASTSSGIVANYILQRCQGSGCTTFAQVAAPAVTTYNDMGLLAGTSYSYQVQAVDTAGNLSMFSTAATATTQTPQPPTMPSNLIAASASASQINLSWAASTSNVGLAHYVVQRCQGAGCFNFAQIATPTGITYSDTGLSSGTSYTYQVQAVDTAGNVSMFSNISTATTQAGQQPTEPGNLTAIGASRTQVDLNWTASTSNIGLKNYVVQRCQGAGCTSFMQIATPSKTTYNDTGLSSSTSYSYQVQAVDTAGNTSAFSNIASATTGYVLPLKASSNNRYLVDQNGTPFLIMGDSPQALVGNLDPTDTATYMADRERLGFNSLWVNLLCDTYTFCNSNGTTYNGVAPFTTGSSPSNYDLSTPNSAYFSIVDNMLNQALADNLVVFLDPIETGGWLTTLENSGTTKAFNYGVYIGTRYKSFPNIVWLHGNDFESWSFSTTDNSLVMQVMAGIASVDPNRLQTIELNFLSSFSNQDSALGSLLTLDSAYTYYETYDMVLQSYNSHPTIPTYLVEANYEYENNTGTLPDFTGPYVLREQAYWTMLSGGVGQIYGNHFTTSFPGGWQTFLDGPGDLEIQYINQLFGTVAWWELVPDTTHEVVTGGYGTYHGSNSNLTTATYCTTSWISGSLAMTYCPNATTLTVNLAQFSGAVTAQWYDPSNGSYTAISGSPFLNSGSHAFTTPGNNHDGNPDWVLVLHI